MMIVSMWLDELFGIAGGKWTSAGRSRLISSGGSLTVEVFIQSWVPNYYEGARYLKIYLSLQLLKTVVPFRKG